MYIGVCGSVDVWVCKNIWGFSEGFGPLKGQCDQGGSAVEKWERMMICFFQGLLTVD